MSSMKPIAEGTEPLQTEGAYRRAYDELWELIMRENLDEADNTRLLELLHLVEAYEQEHHSPDVLKEA